MLGPLLWLASVMRQLCSVALTCAPEFVWVFAGHLGLVPAAPTPLQCGRTTAVFVSEGAVAAKSM